MCVVGLTSCVNYVGIHGNSKPLDATTLSKQNVYKIPTKVTTAYWWRRFNDPQLNQLINVALADSPDLQMAENRVRLARELTNGQEASLWPTLDASGYLERERFSKYGLAPPPFNGRVFNITQAGLNFNYEFDFWGKNRQAVAARISEACAAEADAAEARLVISTSVASTYFDLQSNIAKLNIATATWNHRKETLKIVMDRTKSGIDSDIPVKTALTDEQTARIYVGNLREREMILRHQLAVLLGKNPLSTEIETKKFSYHQYHVTLPQSLPIYVLAYRPDVTASRLRTEAAAHDVNVSKAKFFPNINLMAVYGFLSVVPGKAFDHASTNNAIQGAIDLPIFDAGARKADLRVNYAEYDLAVNSYNKTILNALREVADQISTIHVLNSQINSQNNAFRATRQNYQLVRSRYRHGIVDYIQVLEIQDAMLEQQSKKIDLEAQHLQATVAMIKALGGHDLSGR